MLVFAFSACGSSNAEGSVDPAGTQSDVSTENGSAPEEASSEISSDGQQSGTSEEISETEVNADEYFTNFDQTQSFDDDDTTIVFDGTSVRIEGVGATADGAFVTVTAAGTYVVSGKSSNGQIIVQVNKTDKVRLVLNGLDLTCSKSAPIWVKSADKVAITLAEGSNNYLTDGKTYIYDNSENEPNACLFSKDDLTLNGSGSLTVSANNNNGIGSKDDLRIFSGNITVSAAKNAIKGNDSVSVNSAVVLNITKCKDGIKADTEDDVTKGYVYIRGGDITINASDDGIQATRKVVVEGGKITVSARSNVINCEGEVSVAKDVITEK